MWQLDNRTPYAPERTWVRDRDGAEIWIVVVKCSFDIHADGTTEAAAAQPPVTQFPEYADPAAPARSSLRHELDLVRTKLTTDVLLLGEAHAPGGVPVTRLDVGFRVGPVVKRLRVTGDRFWQGGAPSSNKLLELRFIRFDVSAVASRPAVISCHASAIIDADRLGTQN